MSNTGISKVFAFTLLLSCLIGCKQKTGQELQERQENTEFKRMLQGIWLDESENLAFQAKGDTILYPDSTSMSVAFKVYDDSIAIGGTKYGIVKLSPHFFCMKNQNGDVVKYTKTDDSEYNRYFEQRKVDIAVYSGVVKTDTVFMWQGERYHSYIAVNPTKYKVICNVLNDDGVEVGNVYYDNIIHLSVYHGERQIFSRDFRKHEYAKFVPKDILDKSILNKMEFSHGDADGLHFYTSICMPGAVSCYMLDTRITYEGELLMELLGN